jgi:hypothetical protein
MNVHVKMLMCINMACHDMGFKVLILIGHASHVGMVFEMQDDVTFT